MPIGALEQQQPDSPGRLRAALLLVPVVLSVLLAAAHFMRANQPGLMLVSLLAPLALLSRRAWAVRALQLLLLAGGMLWLRTTLQLVELRLVHNLPWLRLALILGSVTLFTAGSALTLESRTLRQLLARGTCGRAGAWSFGLTFALLAAVQVTLPDRPMLLAERFVPTLGWLEVLALALYAAWVTEKLSDPQQTARWRRRVWLLFSMVFFAQLALGLLGFERFLMSADRMHFPIPALIVAGPLFRGEHFFMLILFGATVLLVGPAWCSHLCYLGVWDQLAADRRKLRSIAPRRRHPLRVGLLLGVVGAAILLRLLGASTLMAGSAALVFGLVGVGVIVAVSRRRGVLVHCTVFCPVGLLATLLGRINPFRVAIAEGCDRCMRCKLACRYDALDREAVAQGAPRATLCTLCGDCLASCREGYLEYRLFGRRWRPAAVRAAFIVLVVALHASTLGLARI